MQRNWVMQYSNGRPLPQRFDAPDTHWLDLQDRLNRLGGSHTWQQLQQLGQIAKTDYQFGSLCAQKLAEVCAAQAPPRH